MLDRFDDTERVAAGASELLLDFGAYLTGGKRPSRVLLGLFWLLTVGGALAVLLGVLWL